MFRENLGHVTDEQTDGQTDEVKHLMRPHKEGLIIKLS